MTSSGATNERNKRQRPLGRKSCVGVCVASRRRRADICRPAIGQTEKFCHPVELCEARASYSRGARRPRATRGGNAMTIALWCVLIAGLAPYVVFGPAAAKIDNRLPRVSARE